MAMSANSNQGGIDLVHSTAAQLAIARPVNNRAAGRMIFIVGGKIATIRIWRRVEEPTKYARLDVPSSPGDEQQPDRQDHHPQPEDTTA